MNNTRTNFAIPTAPTPRPARGRMRIREHRLDEFWTDKNRIMVEISDPDAPSPSELKQVYEVLRRNNFVFYQYGDRRAPGDAGYQRLCARLGLTRRIGNPAADRDLVSRISADDNDGREADTRRYIPYTRRELKWHTDGYYNADADRVGAFVLHCEQAAAKGGANQFMDPEVLFLILREQDPDLVDVLSAPDTFTVPANIRDGRTIRPGFTGPVFDTDATGHLAMRYSERGRNLEWHGDEALARARAAIHALLHHHCEWIVSHTLAPGQGVIANNVLHRRDSFTDHDHPHSRRCLRRIRFRDRVTASTSPGS